MNKQTNNRLVFVCLRNLAKVFVCLTNQGLLFVCSRCSVIWEPEALQKVMFSILLVSEYLISPYGGLGGP